MKLSAILLTIIVLAMPALATAAAMGDKPSSYIVFKGGMYDSTTRFNISNQGFDTDARFFGEGAIGHYFLPFLAFELGGGYFDTKGTAAQQAGTAKLKVVPVVLTGKLLAQIGIVEPYILGGIGAYITDFKSDANLAGTSGATKITYGLHAGAGINFDITSWFFAGAEARYLWVEPRFGGQDIKLDGVAATGNLGFRF